jgi:AAA15 family ATPase/GTPase
MLLRFEFANFRSFRDQQELSLVAGSLKDHPEVLLKSTAIREHVLPVAAIYGANASGKTNVLRAFEFMANAVRSSHRGWPPDKPIPFTPFLGTEESKRAASRFVGDFVIGGIRYQYGFALDSEAILEEWLFAYPSGKKQIWFSRTPGKPIQFGAKMPGENKTIENLTRKNSLFLSAAAQNNHAVLLPIYKWFPSHHAFIQRDRVYAQLRTVNLCSNPEVRARIASLIAAADLGIVELQHYEEKVSEDNPLIEAIISALKSMEAPVEAPAAMGKIRVLHRAGSQTIPFALDDESEGTQAFFALLGPVTRALATGGIICVDELDASLHPVLCMQLIRLFSDPSSNSRAGQLIFNTHDTNLLSSGLLRRDQIWFTEKNNDGSTHLYPLSDFKPRKNENLESGYLQGRYGAIPFLNTEAFLQSFEAADGKT